MKVLLSENHNRNKHCPENYPSVAELVITLLLVEQSTGLCILLKNQICLSFIVIVMKSEVWMYQDFLMLSFFTKIPTYFSLYVEKLNFSYKDAVKMFFIEMEFYCKLLFIVLSYQQSLHWWIILSMNNKLWNWFCMFSLLWLSIFN